MAYAKNPAWRDGIYGDTPITAASLNHIEDGIASAHQMAGVNVCDFGAVPDYNRSARTGTDSTTAIQAALDAATAAGDTLHFPAGHYAISATLTVASKFGLHITAAAAGLRGGLTQMAGAWLHWEGAASAAMLHIDGTSDVLMDGLGFHGRSLADGILITSENSPAVTNHTYRNLWIFRTVNGVYVNDAGGVTQSDQMLFESVRMAEITTNCFRTNSVNVTGLRFLRCSTGIAGSGDDTVHYLFDRGLILNLDSCFGGYGQDFARITSESAGGLVLDGCQWEGSTNADRAFIRIGAAGNATVHDTTTMRNCTVDGPVLVVGGTRQLVTIGNTWRESSMSVVKLIGSDTVHTSLGEYIPTADVITGANAASFKPDSKYIVGGSQPTLSAGTHGSTGMGISGNLRTGTITFTTSATLAADTYAVVVALTTALTSGGYTVQLTPGNVAAIIAQAYIPPDQCIGSQWEIFLHNPPASATQMVFYYRLG